MGKRTALQFAHHTFSPWLGCTKVSPACARCCAEAQAKRTGFDVWGREAERIVTSEEYWRLPHRWNLHAELCGTRRRVYCATMGDVFEDREDLKPYREELWTLIETTPALDWLLGTMRPENILSMVPPSWRKEPRGNVWFGATVEMSKYAARRIPKLRRVPATVRFLALEPLLEPIDLSSYLGDGLTHWVIVGGESGAGARPMHPAWVRQIIAQCRAAAVPCFVRSLGQAWARANGFVGKGRTNGGDPSDWPREVRVREFPGAVPPVRHGNPGPSSPTIGIGRRRGL